MWSIINIFKDGMSDKLGYTSYVALVIFNILYFSTLFGIFLINASYIDTFNIVVHSLLCLFLIYRFNPLRKNVEINKYDQILIFSTALFLLVNLGIVEYFKKMFVNENYLMKMNTKTSQLINIT
jgi:predicted neutral ceramidase superfamily lipid hydrolase